MLFLLELAQNHAGNLDRGKEIIRQFSEVTKKFPQFDFGFKFQRRELDTFLHPDYRNRLDIPYIKRFVENQLSAEELKELQEYARSLGYLTVCTPFDEYAVDTIRELGFDYLKIGSCSITDWPLLSKIADSNLPVIGSIGGTSLEDVYRVVSFFNNRQIPLILMYCVGLYPTEDNQLSLNNLDELQRVFPDIQIGFSTHERPDNYQSVKIAIAKGVRIFEKHVDIEHVNRYSIVPIEYEKYLDAVVLAEKMCEINPIVFQEEKDKLRTLQRGSFLKKDVKEGDTITREDLFFAFPIVSDSQLAANKCSKYVYFRAMYDIKKNSPLESSKVNIIDNSTYIEKIRGIIKDTLIANHIVYPSMSLMEISHHYGLDKFYEYGMCLITLVNQSYCKKLLVLLPGQTNPEHSHKKKKETFFVLSGEAVITLNGETHTITKGNLINIPPNAKHSISSTTGAVIEELSSKHYVNDSFYTDDTITQNSDRKTTVYV